jgi:hypothetical protein
MRGSAIDAIPEAKSIRLVSFIIVSPVGCPPRARPKGRVVTNNERVSFAGGIAVMSRLCHRPELPPEQAEWLKQKRNIRADQLYRRVCNRLFQQRRKTPKIQTEFFAAVQKVTLGRTGRGARRRKIAAQSDAIGAGWSILGLIGVKWGMRPAAGLWGRWPAGLAG